MRALPGFLIFGFVLYCGWAFDPELGNELILGFGVLLCGGLLLISLSALKHFTGPINVFALIGLGISIWMLVLVRRESTWDLLAAVCLMGVFAVCAFARRRDTAGEPGTFGLPLRRGAPRGVPPAGGQGRYGNSAVAGARTNVTGLSSNGAVGQGQVVVRLDANNQYTSPGAINGLPVTFTIDTGASEVAIPLDLAYRLGLRGSGHSIVQTVNGDVPVQNVVLNEVVLGNIRVRNVVGHIVLNMASDVVLLGNSFLRHTRFEHNDGFLILRPRH